MKLKNDFSEETRALFIWNNECWCCGSNRGLELHHIFGRTSDSPLNAAVLCNRCHNRHHRQSPFSEEDKRRMLQKTVRWLLRQDHGLTKKDIEFFNHHKKYYD